MSNIEDTVNRGMSKLKLNNIISKRFFAIVLFFIIAASYCIGCISNLVVAVEEVVYIGYDTLYASGVLPTPRDITSLKSINIENISSSEDYYISDNYLSSMNEIKSTYGLNINEEVYSNTNDIVSSNDITLSKQFLNLTHSDKLNQVILSEFISKLPSNLNKVIKNNYIEITIDRNAVDLNKIFYSKSNTLPDIVEINKGLHGFTFTEIDYVNNPSITALIVSSKNPGHIELVVENGIPVVIKTSRIDWEGYLPAPETSIPKYTVTNTTFDMAKQYLQKDDARSKKYGLQCLTEMLLLSFYCENYQGSSLFGLYDPQFDYEKYYSVLKSLNISDTASELGSNNQDHLDKITSLVEQAPNSISMHSDTVNYPSSDFKDESNKDSLYYEQPNNTTQDIYVKDEQAIKDVLEIDKTLNNSSSVVSNATKDDFNLGNFFNTTVNVPATNTNNSTTNDTTSSTDLSTPVIAGTSSNNPTVSFWIDDDSTSVNYLKSKEELEKERLEGLKKALSVNKTPMVWGVAYNGDNFAVVDKDGSSLLYNAFTKFKYNFTTLADKDDYMHQLVITKATPLKTLPRIIPSGMVKSVTPNYLIPFALYSLAILIFICFIVFMSIYTHNEKRRKRLEITKRERATYESTLFDNFDSYNL